MRLSNSPLRPFTFRGGKSLLKSKKFGYRRTSHKMRRLKNANAPWLSAQKIYQNYKDTSSYTRQCIILFGAWHFLHLVRMQILSPLFFKLLEWPCVHGLICFSSSRTFGGGCELLLAQAIFLCNI